MDRARRTGAQRKADTAAERRVHGAILGYQPYRMKPVHFATSFLLALTGRCYRLEYLNKASVPKTAPRGRRHVHDEYPSDRLRPVLVELGKLDPSVDLESFRTLRAHLNAAYNNDGSALSAVFPPYSTFGADYSAPSTRYISDRSKNHGYSGSFVVSVFEATADGREALETIMRLLRLPPATAGCVRQSRCSTTWTKSGAIDTTNCTVRSTRSGWRGSGREWETARLR